MLFDFHKQMYNDTMTAFQKQEKTISQIQSQIKTMAEKLDNIGEKKRLEWWEVLYI